LGTVDRSELTARILAARLRREKSWAEVAEAVGRDRVWTTAACLGQHPFDADGAQRLLDVLGVSNLAEGSSEAEIRALLTAVPTRGSFDSLPPTDPTIYRLYEVLQVYGPALKELLHEDFGDGIMSAINFRLGFEREDRDGEARVKITLDGTYLPYAW
jgi:cyanate lyase